ncbi:hypothetical protein [Clostridium saccharoperbutylacetonicum]|jgi:hypothetical protein|uniref:hypothetical protein n=1 Tax=Clostridium saccharoperbutylacetonicum TaxID=36745 RepID=UPI0009839452|nr:hypothetical protein [Clostridium saccharoperbutylacetonicum]AQR97383.1 hypothetical protein CLSAP_47070 [Clostridium saccharoperbutylacetonicum]NSB33267.1 hypothetical protein [Clostridium saccharoperbutylacetonicum]
MIICVNQVKSNRSNKFEIEVDGNLKYCVQVPWSSVRLGFGIRNIKKIKVINMEEEVSYTADYNVVENAPELMILCGDLFDNEQKVMKINILDKYSANCGSIYTKTNGFFDSKICVTSNDEMFLGYDVSKGNIQTISFYKEDVEIAQITKPLSVRENLDCYYIHILDEYSYIADILSFFVIYFDYVYYGHVDESVVMGKREVSFEYTFDKRKKFYNESWIREKFGEEEYKRFTDLLEYKYNVVKGDIKNRFIIVLLLFGVLAIKLISDYFS